MEATQPRLDEPKSVNRKRWWVHLVLITSYLLVVALLSMMRNKPNHPALSHTATGLLIVCGAELLLFGIIFAAAWAASRASRDDLRLRWRGKGMPVLLGLGYSVSLRIAVGVLIGFVGMVLILSHVMTPDSMRDFFDKNRPGVENLVDVSAMRNNAAYFWLSLTVVSFVVAGLREELWRASFLAGLEALWPRQFCSTPGKVCAVGIAAIIFGLGHVSMGVIASFMAGALGFGLGLIMVFHRSIWPAVLAHGFFDATSMALIPWALEVMHHLPKP